MERRARFACKLSLKGAVIVIKPLDLPDLSDGEREFLKESRALQTDANNREVFVGLTRAESEEYVRLLAGQPLSDTESERLDELAEKHETMRTQIIGAEVEAREVGTKH
jgi:hypothetical protein